MYLINPLRRISCLNFDKTPYMELLGRKVPYGDTLYIYNVVNDLDFFIIEGTGEFLVISKKIKQYFDLKKSKDVEYTPIYIMD